MALLGRESSCVLNFLSLITGDPDIGWQKSFIQFEIIVKTYKKRQWRDFKLWKSSRLKIFVPLLLMESYFFTNENIIMNISADRFP